MRRALKWIGILLGSLVGLVILAVGVLLIVLHTDWGREQVRLRGEKALNAAMNGKVYLGRVRGSVLTKFTVEGLIVTDPAGNEVVRSGKLLVDYDLLAIFRRDFVAESVELESPIVFGRLDEQGKLNLNTLLKPSESESAPWAVHIESVHVKDGLFIIPTATETYSFAKVNLDTGVTVEPHKKRVDIVQAGAIWLERGLPVAAHGNLVASEHFIAFAGLEVIAGESRIALPLGFVRPEAEAVVARLDVSIRQADLFHFWPHTLALGDAKLEGAVVRPGKGKPLDARLEAKALGGSLRLAAQGNPDVPAVSGKLAARGIGSPLPSLAAEVNLDLAFDAAGSTLESLKGTVDLQASGRIAGRTIDKLEVAAVAGGGQAHADLTALLPEGKASAHADLQLQQPLILDELRVDAHADDVGAAASVPNVDGAVDLHLQASGPLDNLRARGKLAARKVAAGSARTPQVDANFDFSGLPKAPRGNLTVEARKVVVGKDRLGGVRVRADATGDRAFAVRIVQGAPGLPYSVRGAARVTLEERGTHIRLDQLVAVVRGLTITGAAGGEVLLARNGGVSARDFAFTSDAGNIEIEGDLAPARSGTQRTFSQTMGKLHLHLAEIDLERMRASFVPEMKPMAGNLSADLHVVRDGHNLGLEGEVVLTGVALAPRMPVIDATARLNAGQGKIIAVGHARARAVRGNTVGIADFSLDAEAPRNLLDADAWKKVEVDQSINGARIVLRDVDVHTLGVLAGRRDLKGRIDATVLARPEQRDLDIKISFNDLAGGQFTDLDITADGTWSRDAFVMTMDASLDGIKALEAEARIGAGLNTLLRGVDMTRLPVEASVDFERLELTRLTKAVPPLAGRAEGTLTGKARLRGTLDRPVASADLRLDQAKVGGVPFRSLGVEAFLDSVRVEGRVTALQIAGGTLEASAHVDRVRDNAVDARLVAHQLDLAFLSALAAKRTDALAGAGGHLDADFSVQASKSARSANGRLAIHKGQIYNPNAGLITDIELAAHVENGRAVLEKLTARGAAGTGTLRAEGDAVLVGLTPQSFSARFASEKFPVNAGPMVVSVSVDGSIDGRGDEQAWRMKAIVRDARVRLPQQRRSGEPLQKTGELEDVVFTDVPGFHQRTGYLALTGSPEAARTGGRDLVLALETPRGIEVSGQDVDLLINTQDLQLVMSDGQASIGGGVSVNRGFIELFDRRYDIIRASASFNEHEPVNPHLDIRLAHEFHELTLFIDVGGTLEEPTLDLSTDRGSYDQAQLIGWVLGGNPDDPAVGKQPLDQQALGMASNLVLGQVQQLVKKALPVDVLAVKVGEGSDTQTTRFEVGKWLTTDLFLGYIYRMNAPEDKNLNEAQVEYRLGRRWLLEAFFGDRGVAGADITWSKKY